MYKRLPTINIDLRELLDVCSDDSNRDYLELERQVKDVYHDVFGYQKYGESFNDTVVCYNNGLDVVGFFRPSYEEFIRKLSYYLNIEIDPYTISEIDLDKLFYERLATLKGIKSPQELANSFPVIYQDFLIGRRMRNDLDAMSRETEEDEKLYQQRRHDYFSYGFKWRFDRFIKTQAEMYQRFVERRGELSEKIEKTSFNPYLRRRLNPDLLTMYVVDGYLNIARDTTNMITRRTYLRLVETYFSSKYSKNMTVNLKSRFIDYPIIKKRYQALMKTVREKDGYAEWELIPDGFDFKHPVLSDSSRAKKISVDPEKVERWRQIGKRNQTFYDSTEFLARVVGVSKYSGYVGYIYPNGRVLLDKEFNEEAPSSAVGNAIFYMKAIDFEELSRLDKTTLKKHPKVGRITHQGYWEERAKEIIEAEATAEDRQASADLVRKLKR